MVPCFGMQFALYGTNKNNNKRINIMVALFVVFTFIILIVIDIVVLKAQKRKHPAFADASKAVFNKNSLSLPERIFVSKGHTWAELVPGGFARVGVDEFVLKSLGKISVNYFAKEQTTVKQGEVIFQGTSGKGTFSFRSPIDGVIQDVNRNLTNIQDPYRNDWGVIISPSNWADNTKSLKNGQALVSWLKDEFSRLKDFLAVNSMNTELAGVTMHDGGNIMEGAVTYMKAEGLKNFENEFLTF
ncbi:MAG: hypothetical protein ACM3MI_08645 [Clostridiales bacterium]